MNKGLATEASADWDVLCKGPHLLSITVKVRRGGSVPDARRALEQEIDRLGKEGISAPELEKARRKAQTELLLWLEDVGAGPRSSARSSSISGTLAS